MEFIFNKHPDNLMPEIINQVYPVQLGTYNFEDITRLCKKRFYDNGIDPDVNKIILVALDKYLDKEMTEEDLKKLKEIKNRELREIRDMKRLKKPIFTWDLKKNKTKGN